MIVCKLNKRCIFVPETNTKTKIMTTTQANTITKRANKIVSFTFTNQFETEASWLSKTLKSFVNTYGRQNAQDENELSDVWFSLIDALKTVEDVKLENKRNK